MSKWDHRFLSMAALVGSWSKDPSTKCGCVIVDGNRIISLGFNGYPHGLEDKKDKRGVKYDKTIHAELNAILHAKQPLIGRVLYTWPMQPCAKCAAVIIQSGISKVIVGIPVGMNDTIARWADSFFLAETMLREAGVELELKVMI